MMRDARKQKQRTMQLMTVLLVVAAAIYAFTFFKLAVWLPVLK